MITLGVAVVTTGFATIVTYLWKLLPCGPAGRLKGPQGLEGTVLGVSFERESELEQSRHQMVVSVAAPDGFAVAVTDCNPRFC